MNCVHISYALAVALTLVSCAGQIPADYGNTGANSVQKGLDVTMSQLARSLDALTDLAAYPRSTLDDGTWRTVDASDWTSGFFPGLLWLAFEATGEEHWARHAGSWNEGLREEQFTTSHHDLGFILYNSFGHGYRLNESDEYRAILLQAAHSLATRYSDTVDATKSWDWSREWQFPVIIDNLLNIELFFWAARETGDQRFYDMAVSHAHRTADYHLREDGSTFHVVDFDSTTGEVLERVTHQGYADSSTWSRGQAWGLYGFTMAYRETNEPRFLEKAVRIADYFLENAPPDLVPFWDFDAPEIPDEPRDVSAAAIVFSGLIELQGLVEEESRRRYKDATDRLLSSLTSDAYLNTGSDSFGVLRHGVGNRPAGREVDVGLIYADYYFLEGLLRYRAHFITGIP